SNLRMRTKLAILLLLPILGLLFFAGSQVRDRAAVSGQLGQVETLAALNGRVDTLVHELQKERGRTGLFVGGDGTQYRTELTDQRKATDATLVEVGPVIERFDGTGYGAAFTDRLDAIRRQLADLSAHRQRVDGRTLAAKDATGYYTGVIGAMLGLSS